MKRAILLSIILVVLVQNDGFAARIKILNKLNVPEFNFCVDSVIVAQDEKFILGHRLKHKKLIPLKLKEKRIDLALQNLFQKSFPLAEDKRLLIIKVNLIIFNTFDRNSEFAANFTFVEKVGGEYIDLGTIKIARVDEKKYYIKY